MFRRASAPAGAGASCSDARARTVECVRTVACARPPASLMWCGPPRGSRMTSPRFTRPACASPSIRSTSSPSSMRCKVPVSAKLTEKVRSGAYATIRSPLRRTLRSSSESKSCGRPYAAGPGAASPGAGGSANSRGGPSKSAGVAGRSARCSGGTVIVSAHSSDYVRRTVSRATNRTGSGPRWSRSVSGRLLPLAKRPRHRKFARHSRPGLGPLACADLIAAGQT